MEDEAFIGGVLAIQQDNYGFIWIGGRLGLARYDGYSFRLYRHDKYDRNSIASNTIHDIALDADGNLWLATEVGLDRFDYATETFEHYKHNETDPNSIGVSPVFRCI